MRTRSSTLDPGAPHERTALAWERTAIALLANRVLLARYAARDAHWTIAGFGLAETVAGGALLIWAGFHYDELHGLPDGGPIDNTTMTRLIGGLSVGSIGVALVLASLLALIS